METAYLLEQLLNIFINIRSYLVVLSLFIVTKVIWINAASKHLAILKDGADLIWKPGGDWGTSSGSWVLSVVHDVLSDHGPVLMAEFEGLVHGVEEQIGRFAVLHRVLLEFVFNGLLSELVNIFLVVVRSVISQFEEVLSEGVSWVFKPESAVRCRNDAVLCTSLSSECHNFSSVLFNTLVDDTSSGENVLVTLNAHDEGSEFQISCWRALSPHGVEQSVDFFQEGNAFLEALVDHISIISGDTCVNLVVSSTLLIRFGYDGDVKQDETMFVNTSVELSNQLEVAKRVFRRFDNIVVVVVWILRVFVIGEFPVVEGVCLAIIEEWLLVVETISEHFHWNRQIFWEMIHSCSIGPVFKVLNVAWFEKIGGTEHGEVSEERSVEAGILWVDLLDLVSVVWEIILDSLSKGVFGQKTL